MQIEFTFQIEKVHLIFAYLYILNWHRYQFEFHMYLIIKKRNRTWLSSWLYFWRTLESRLWEVGMYVIENACSQKNKKIRVVIMMKKCRRIGINYASVVFPKECASGRSSQSSVWLSSKVQHLHRHGCVLVAIFKISGSGVGKQGPRHWPWPARPSPVTPWHSFDSHTFTFIHHNFFPVSIRLYHEKTHFSHKIQSEEKREIVSTRKRGHIA